MVSQNRRSFSMLSILKMLSIFSGREALTGLIYHRPLGENSYAYICNWLAGYLNFYVLLLPSDLVSTVIISPPLQLPCQKRPTMVQMFSLINILNCLPPHLASYLAVCSQAGTYKINYIDQQFFYYCKTTR